MAMKIKLTQLILVLICLFFINVPAFAYNNYNYYNYAYNPTPQWQIYYNNGEKHANQKNYNAALSDFTKSINLNPNNAGAYSYRAAMYFQLKNYDAAINDLDNAVSLDYKNANYYYYRGAVKKVKKDYYGSIADFTQAIELDPENESYYLWRGDRYKDLKKYFSALKDYKASLKIKNSEDTIASINAIQQDFRNPTFLIANIKPILEDLGYIQCWILLTCIIIIFTNAACKKITFTEYNKDYICQRFHFERLNINTPVPRPEEFSLDRNRIDYLEKIYQRTKNISYFNSDTSDWSITLSIILSFFFMGFIDNILTMYFNFLNEDWKFIYTIGIPAIIIYFAIKKIPILFSDITPHESKTYLLYKGALELYNEKMATIKAAEEERLRKIREEEERKLKQQRSYWEKYWAEKQKDGFKFEEAVGELYKKLGNEVTVTQGTGDGGVDLILYKDGIKTIVQCKAHTHQVGPEPVRALWGVREDFNATNAIFVAYSGVTSGAHDFARGKKLQILDVNGLIQLSLNAYSEQGVSNPKEKVRQKAEVESQNSEAEKQTYSYWQKYWAEKQKNIFEFNRAVGELYGKMGYGYKVISGTYNDCVDLVLYKDGIKVIVQCNSRDHVVVDSAVRALWDIRENYSAQKAIFIAYSGVTSGAWDFARGKKLQILDVNDLIRLSLEANKKKG